MNLTKRKIVDLVATAVSLRDQAGEMFERRRPLVEACLAKQRQAAAALAAGKLAAVPSNALAGAAEKRVAAAAEAFRLASEAWAEARRAKREAQIELIAARAAARAVLGPPGAKQEQARLAAWYNEANHRLSEARAEQRATALLRRELRQAIAGLAPLSAAAHQGQPVPDETLAKFVEVVERSTKELKALAGGRAATDPSGTEQDASAGD